MSKSQSFKVGSFTKKASVPDLMSFTSDKKKISEES